MEAAQQGRNLHLTLDGVESPFVIRPLVGEMGSYLTNKYIEFSAGHHEVFMEQLLMIAVDGGMWADTDKTELIPVPDGANWARFNTEISLAEVESVALGAMFWQTILGIKGVQAFIDGGEGMAGGVKALWALVSALAISPTQTAPSTALELLIQSQALSPHTPTQTGGGTLAKLPPNKRGFLKKRSKA